MEDKILTLHPDSKEGVNISRAKYDQIRTAMLAAFEMEGELLFKELPAAVEVYFDVPFEGSLGWYVTTVKLDLEARGLIERVHGSRPQRLRLVQQSAA